MKEDTNSDTKPTVLHKDREVVILRLNKDTVQLKTTPDWKNYMKLAFFEAIVLFILIYIALALYSGLKFLYLGDSTEPVLVVLIYAGGLFVILLLGYVSLSVLRVGFPVTFVVDSAERVCRHSYCLFLKSKIPFDAVECFEAKETPNDICFYVRRKDRFLRTWVFRAEGEYGKACRGPKRAVEIFTDQFEKAGITLRSKEV